MLLLIHRFSNAFLALNFPSSFRHLDWGEGVKILNWLGLGLTVQLDPSNTRMSDASSNSTSGSSGGSSSSSMEYWEAIAESCVRITLAGFAGSLIGLAKERQGYSNAMPDAAETLVQLQQQRNATQGIRGGGVRGYRPRRPPPVPIKTASTNLPMTWSLSCMLFAAVLESSRRASPADLLWKLTVSDDKSLVESTDSDRFQEQAFRQAIVSMGDYSVGGAAAGLAGAVGQNRHLLTNRSLAIRSGLLTGLGLGLLAGAIQAAIDIGNFLLMREQEHEADDQHEDPEVEHATSK
jgi:hypothetical protein